MTKEKRISAAWAETQKLLKGEVAKHVYEHRIQAGQVGEFSEDAIMIKVASEHVNWLNGRVAVSASKIITGILNQPYQVIFSDNGTPPPSMKLDDRKAQLTQAYGETRAAVIKPQQVIMYTAYFWSQWRPILGRTTTDVVIACRSLCYWNIKTGELRSTVTTDRDQIAGLANCSYVSVDRALSNKFVKMYFVRKRIARIMTSEGIRNHGLILSVRMDDPLTPQHQEAYKINEPTTWIDPSVDQGKIT